MTSLVVLSLLAGVPLPQECEPPPLHDVAPLKTFAQKSGTLSVGLDSVATWCFDSGGAWTAGQRAEGKKPKAIDPNGAPVGDCARALASCDEAKAALTDDLTKALTDSLADLDRPYRGQKYPPKRSGLNERPNTAVNCKERSRPDLFAQAQSRMDLARLASTVQNEYANYKTWLFARGLECAQQVRSGKVDTTRVSMSLDAPGSGGGAAAVAGGPAVAAKGSGGGTAVVGAATTPGKTAALVVASSAVASGGGSAGGGTTTTTATANPTGTTVTGKTNVTTPGATTSATTNSTTTPPNGSAVTTPTTTAPNGTTVATTNGTSVTTPAGPGKTTPNGTTVTTTTGTTVANAAGTTVTTANGTVTTPAGTVTTTTGTTVANAAGTTVTTPNGTTVTTPAGTTVTTPGGTTTITPSSTTTTANGSANPPTGALVGNTTAPAATGTATENMLETWRGLANQRAKMELDRDYTLGFLASRELRDCRCQRSSPAGIVSRLESQESVAQLEADHSRAVACERCLQTAFAAWRSRISKQCSLMNELSQYELEVLQRSDDGNGLPPRCWQDVVSKRGLDGGVLLAVTPNTAKPPPTTTTVTIPMVSPDAGSKLATVTQPTGVPRFEPTSPLADGFFRPSEPAPMPLREDGRLYVRV
ncbi:MAG: hypothetical protein JNM69_40850, partial [Archangium sp.]|nr:hypothetical protein [Archangium sp.]